MTRIEERPILGGPLTPVVVVNPYSTLPSGVIEVSEIWNATHVEEKTANDSDKSFTITAGNEWQILGIQVKLVTTATVGDRQLEVRITDAGGDIIHMFRAGALQPASLTRYYELSPGVGDLLGFRDTDLLTTPIPPTLVIPAGYIIRIWDNNAVDAAADDMEVYIHYAYRAV